MRCRSHPDDRSASDGVRRNAGCVIRATTGSSRNRSVRLQVPIAFGRLQDVAYRASIRCGHCALIEVRYASPAPHLRPQYSCESREFAGSTDLYARGPGS
jgi:hypothetical protein